MTGLPARRARHSRHARLHLAVDRDALSLANLTAAAGSRLDVRAPRGSELAHEGIVGAAKGRLEGMGGREVGRGGLPRHIGLALAVHRDAIAQVIPTAPEEG